MLLEWRPLNPRFRYRENYAYILDIVPPTVLNVREEDIRRYKLIHYPEVLLALGEDYFTLLILTPKPQVNVEVGERVYIGSGFRPKIDKIVRRVNYEDLTREARDAIQKIVPECIVDRREQYFVDFFNKAQPITPRLHMLELLKGIGPKTLRVILEERAKKPFGSFDDIKQRVKIDARAAVINRIFEELSTEQKYYLFVAPRPPTSGP